VTAPPLSSVSVADLPEPTVCVGEDALVGGTVRSVGCGCVPRVAWV